MTERENLYLYYYHLFLDCKLNLRPATNEREKEKSEKSLITRGWSELSRTNLHLAARAEVELIDACS
jgi:hypothetical protein